MTSLGRQNVNTSSENTKYVFIVNGKTDVRLKVIESCAFRSGKTKER